MADVKAEIIGKKELLAKLNAIDAEIATVTLEQAAEAGAKVIEDAAAQKAPRRTGKLAGSMTHEVKNKGKAGIEVVIGPDKEAFYGLFNEFGTSKMSPQPFLRPAMDETSGKVKSVIAAKLKTALK
ncbi:HK97-gp10 family putative phage morphogenesis protein [Mahella australiensis]|uniref:Phage protein, HK97 gp10 family n=1 Tax=Mahella australiensis (strain DSM 15567 / CIP 107919 / 50-1 BON) TaxID=697281 RepID=F4A0G8_MAHA5|nr:HK97-gp10 family putative phage morphogenesis protein [Mahella australiensis]AEE98029.1 phage protein, HK97 gp10 family [Mahella australiensis 50-1 BON]